MNRFKLFLVIFLMNIAGSLLFAEEVTSYQRLMCKFSEGDLKKPGYFILSYSFTTDAHATFTVFERLDESVWGSGAKKPVARAEIIEAKLLEHLNLSKEAVEQYLFKFNITSDVPLMLDFKSFYKFLICERIVKKDNTVFRDNY